MVEHTPHLEGPAKVASCWRHFEPLKSLLLPVDLIVSDSADAEHLAGSRWHVISEAARQGRVLVVQPSAVETPNSDCGCSIKNDIGR